MNKPTLSYVSLTDEQLLLLDGHVEGELETKVIAARNRLDFIANHPEVPEGIAKIICGAVSDAKEKKILVWQRVSLNRCMSCGTDKGYVPFKSGPRKGLPNYSKQIKVRGVELAERYVHMEGSVAVGGCPDCVAAAAPYIAKALDGYEAQIPESITGHAPKFLRLRICKCSCGWTGNENEARNRAGMFGGVHPFQCPNWTYDGGHDKFEIVSGEHVIVPASSDTDDVND